MDWRKLPKVELHRHLDGSIRLQTIIDLAKKHNLDLGVRDSELPNKVIIKEPMSSLKQVLDCFWTSQKVLCSYEAIKRVTFENVEDAFFDGVKLVELRFAPVFIQKNKSIQFDEIIEGVIDGITQGMNKYDIQVGLIHILPRGLEFDPNIKATQEIFRYQKSIHKNADRLVGVDLADPESEDSFSLYQDIIQKSHQLGFGVTIHSGEDTTAAHVKRTLETYPASRIGHGIQIAKDPEVLKLVIEKDVTLEVCPTSNWLTHCVKTLEDHPLKKLYQAGVKVTLSTDDPHIMGINLINEYEVAHSKIGMSTQELIQMNRWALEKSFLPYDIKKSLNPLF
ncbi:MAG: adenosine deaminase [Bacteriovoracaceae bacterium]